MIKTVFRLIALVALVAIVFLALAIWKGGDPFRWVGRTSEQAGEMVREKSEELGREADRIKQRTDSVIATKERVKKGLRKTEDAVRELTGGKADK